MSNTQDYVQLVSLMASLVEHFKENDEKSISNIFSLMLENFIKNSILDFLFAIQVYMQGCL